MEIPGDTAIDAARWRHPVQAQRTALTWTRETFEPSIDPSATRSGPWSLLISYGLASESAGLLSRRWLYREGTSSADGV